MSATKTRLTLATLLTLTGLSSALSAHDNDPKGLNPQPPIYGEIKSASQDGVAGTWAGATQNFTFLSQVPINQLGGSGNGSDCWGYVSPSGREYALITMESAFAVVEVTNPLAPDVIYTYQRGGSSSLWGDVKVVGDHCYLVGEGGGSIRTFDLGNVDNGQVIDRGASSSDGTTASHNIASVPQANLLARCGGGSNGLRFYSTDDPDNPSYLGAYTDYYVHDACLLIYPQSGPDTTYRGKVIGFLNNGSNGGSVNTGLSIVDFGFPSNLNPSGTELSRITWPGAGYSHQGWHNDELTWFISNDETALNNTWQMINITDLDNPSLGFTQSIAGNAVNHNNYVKDNLLYAANYTMGLRVLDCSNGNFMEEIAFFDTYPPNDGGSFDGIWSVYPYLPSGTIVMSDFQSGLILAKLDLSPLSFGFPDGRPDRIPTSGASIDVSATLQSGFDIQAFEMEYAYDGGASGVVAGVEQSSNIWRFDFPSATICPGVVTYSFTAQLTNGETYDDPGGVYSATVSDGTLVVEAWPGSSGSGWTFGVAGDDAVAGIWTSGQVEGNNRGDPAVDGNGNPSGFAFLTGIDPSTTNSDVDDGTTTLLSPIFSGVEVPDSVLSYQRWYSNDFGAEPNADSMQISISNNGGSSWTLVENVSENANAWVTVEFVISDVITPSAQMQMRFVASDLAGGSVIEAGIDNLQIFGVECEDQGIIGDLNGDGFVNGSDIGIFLAVWGTNSELGDLNNDGICDGVDLGQLLAAWTG